ncbi:Uncharacterised protein [Actinomyces viscosus]|uniref:Uncharacterized protein n=1 Tax=Actinomyces viscosus TaxID=1656 RepID=A0A3S5EWK3_ACTVI|nr:Uncharacterised protein [Actinomyces viscosus]
MLGKGSVPIFTVLADVTGYANVWLVSCNCFLSLSVRGVILAINAVVSKILPSRKSHFVGNLKYFINIWPLKTSWAI